MKKSVLYLISIAILSFSSIGRGAILDSDMTGWSIEKHDKLALVTYVSDNVQLRHVKTLIESLRHNGGTYSQSDVYVVISDSLVDCDALTRMQGVKTIQLYLKPEIAAYPYAVKAFAAALAEEAIGDQADYLAWFDPETIIISQPDGLIPCNEGEAVVQPVFLSNTIGIAAGDPLDEYWEPIYRIVKTDYRNIPVVETLIDRKKILAYYNCEVFSVRSDASIFRSWAETLDKLLSDSLYAYGFCNTSLRKIFLHQAALSAVIVHKTAGSAPELLPLSNGYPLHIQQRIPDDRKIDSLDNASCIILENMWEYHPSWIERINASDALLEELSSLYLDFMQVAPGL